MARRATLRASDADRERVAERLRQAAMEGRLLAHELEERLGQAFRALTYGELDALVADLPGDAHAHHAPPQGRSRHGRTRHRRTRHVERRRSMWLEVGRRHPLPVLAVGLFVGLSLAVLVLTAVAVVASGIWLIPLVLFLVLRTRGVGPGDGGRRGPRVRPF